MGVSKLQLREGIRLACIKYGYSYQIDKNGHVNMQGGKKEHRKNARSTCSEAS